MLTEKEYTNRFVIWHCLFLVVYEVFSNLLIYSSQMFLVHLKDYLTIAFQVPNARMRRTKEFRFLNYCSYKINKFLVQNTDLNKRCFMFI